MHSANIGNACPPNIVRTVGGSYPAPDGVRSLLDQIGGGHSGGS